jgi:hypothetical protein
VLHHLLWRWIKLNIKVNKLTQTFCHSISFISHLTFMTRSVVGNMLPVTKAFLRQASLRTIILILHLFNRCFVVKRPKKNFFLVIIQSMLIKIFFSAFKMTQRFSTFAKRFQIIPWRQISLFSKIFNFLLKLRVTSFSELPYRMFILSAEDVHVQASFVGVFEIRDI